MTDPVENSKPAQPESDAVLERARNLLHARQTELFRARQALQQRRHDLLAELRRVEAEIESLRHRIDGIRDTLTSDFPLGRFEKVDWRRLSVPEAACELLGEAGVYLTNRQIRTGLEQHGVTSDDTGAIAQELVEAARQGAPLIKISDDLWARADWAEQARCSAPDLFKKMED